MLDQVLGGASRTLRILCVSCAASFCAAPGQAQELLVHLPLDGSVQNDGSGGPAQLWGGSPPITVPGRIGSAMRFEGDAVIAVPVDLSPNDYPYLTMTAWVIVEDHAPNTYHTVVSGGGGAAAGLRVLARNAGVKTSFKGARAQLLAGDFGPKGEWLFVSGLLDIPGQTLRVVQDDDSYTLAQIRTDTLYPATKHSNPDDPQAERQAYVFVGAESFNVAHTPANGIVLDDVRVYTGNLDDAQLAAAKAGTGTGGGSALVTDAGVDLPGSTGEIGVPDYDSPTGDLLRDRSTAGTAEEGATESIAAPEGTGAGSADIPADAPIAPSDGELDDRRIPSPEELERQGTRVAERQALARAQERREAQAQAAAADRALERDQQASTESGDDGAAEGDERIPTGWHLSDTDVMVTDNAGLPGGGDVIVPGELERPDHFTGPTPETPYLSVGVLQIIEEGNVACAITLLNGSGELMVATVTTNRNRAVCDSETLVVPDLQVDISPTSATGIRICSSRRSERDVRGVHLRGYRVRHDTSFGLYKETVDEDRLCETWRNVQRCEPGYVASGVWGHFRQDTEPYDALVGISLVCRRVIQEYD